jgi:NAD(P)-dependent dehydrogenase (short-subunit alcohol dehydrogenase family)
MATILITGAAGQLGRVVTDYFLNKNYNVIAAVHSPKEKEALPASPRLSAEVVDLANEEATGDFVRTAVQQQGSIDAALLLAGGFAAGDIGATKLTDVKKQMALNFDTAYNLVQPVFQHMMENNFGRIILIGSRPALHAPSGRHVIAYALSKSLLFKLAELLNETAKGRNVSVTVVAPGTIDTPANRSSMPDADTSGWVKPEFLASLFEFVCADRAGSLKETVLKAYGGA